MEDRVAEKERTVRLEEQDKCQKQKDITHDSEKKLQDSLANNASNLKRVIDRLQKNPEKRCIIARPASSNDGTASRDGLPESLRGASILDSEWLANNFSAADDNTSKLLSCQAFVCQIYQLNGRDLITCR